MEILFFHRGVNGFIENDLVLLRGAGPVLDFDSDRMGVGDYLRAFFAAGGRSHPLIYCWFAGRHALFPALLAQVSRRPFVLATGGWDVVNLPEIDYGLMRPGWKKVVAQWILRHATRLLAMSDSSHRELLDQTGAPPAKVSVIPLGVEIPPERVSAEEKQGLVLSVGELTRSNLKRKGIETFVKTAKLLPEKRFVLIGRIREELRPFLKQEVPPNLLVRDYMRREELNEFFRKASVYVQVSYHEGFGCALAEAMAYGCVPVVTDRYALPEVVGSCGVYVPYGDAQKTAEGIRQAFQKFQNLSSCAQERVRRLFPLKERERALVQLLQELADEN